MAGARFLSLLVLFGSLLAAQNTPVTHDYKFIGIQYPGAIRTTLEGLNNHGDIVGTYLDSANVSHGFVLANGKMTELDYPGKATYLRGINDSGRIAGYFGDPYGNGGIVNTSGFTWNRLRGFTLLQYTGNSTDANPNGPFEILAQGLNDGGSVVGSVYNGAAFNNHSKIWRRNTVRDFCFSAWTFGGYEHGVVAMGIANSGFVVGYGVASSQNTDDALVEYPDGTCKKFDTGLNSGFVRLTAISSNGQQLAGTYWHAAYPGLAASSGFVWHAGQAETISYPNAESTEVNGVNVVGVVVGTANVNGSYIGFVAIPTPSPGTR